MDSSVLIDQARRQNAYAPVTPMKGNNYNSNSFLFPSPSLTLQQQHQLLLLLNNHSTTGAEPGFSGSRPPPSPVPPPPFVSFRPPVPPSIHSSLPLHLLPQYSPHPPLLPLPFSRSKSLPSAPSTEATPHRKANINSNNNRKKPRSSSNSNNNNHQRKEAKKPIEAPVIKPPAAKQEDEEENKVYSMSPPPSSLPFPSFSLKPRTGPAISCTAEALGGSGRGGGTVDSSGGATADNLRRLLRL